MKRDEFLKQMIAEYRKKIETYQAMIQEWERELGIPASASAATTMATTGAKSGLTVDVQTWQFLGKSQPEAAKALLKMVEHPLTTEEIIEGIRKGGIEVGSTKYGFYSILSRSDDFVKVKKNTWGLSEWPGLAKKKKPKEEEK